MTPPQERAFLESSRQLGLEQAENGQIAAVREFMEFKLSLALRP